MIIVLTKDQWAKSQLSIARYYGGARFRGRDYRIVNQYGIDVFSLSDPQSEHYAGEGTYAIKDDEPADLVLVEWIPLYRKLGRESFLKLIKDNKEITLEKAKSLLCV